ncbi:MAG: hypothetical protein ABEJ80_02440 [Halarchaeum sp.]
MGRENGGSQLGASGRGRVITPGSDDSALVNHSSRLAEWLDDRYGDALRTVIVYVDDVSEYVYLAERVDDAYSTDELERIAAETAFRDALSNPHFESLFHLGDTEAAVTRFEDATLVQVPFDEDRGVVLTVGRDASLELDALVTALRADHRPNFVENA